MGWCIAAGCYEGMLVKCTLNSKYITDSNTSKAPPHHHTSSSMLQGGNHTCRDHPFNSSASHKDQKPHLDSSDQRTDFYRSNAHCSCFLAHASLFLLLSFRSGFFAAIWPWRPDSLSLLWTVDVSVAWTLKHLFGLQFLRLVTLMNLSFASEVTLVFLSCGGTHESQFHHSAWLVCDCTWRNFKSSWNVPYWLTFMS